MLSFVLVASCVVLVLLATVVLYSNVKSKRNQYLAGFLFAGFLWVLANLFANISVDPNDFLFFARLTIIGASLLAYMFLLFCYEFSEHEKQLRITQKILIFLPVGLLISTTFTDWNIRLSKDSGSTIEIGPVYFFMVPLLLAYFIYGIARLARDYKRTDSKAKKMQLKYLFWGILFSFVPGVIFNAILPIMGYNEGAFFGPVAVLFFAIFSSIAIARHRLLDIRLVVARSITYVLVLGSLTGLFALSIFTVSANIPGATALPPLQQALYIMTAIILAIAFMPLKHYFDHASNRLFYRDAYDPQEFLDELNKVLVTKVDVEPLLSDTVSVIKAHLKSDFCVFNVRKTQYLESRLIGDDKKIDSKDLEEIGKLASHIHESVIVTDELEQEQNELKELLQKNNIAVVARLVTTVEYDVEGVGYIMFGSKKSGSPYGRQDIKMIEIIANELVIAVQNALRFEEIEEFNVTLQKKVDEATKKLRYTNKKLEEMDETKDEFISMASHQLRTPLTSVKGYLSMVLEGDAGEIKPMQERLLSQAYTSSQRMVYLIADLLNVSRLRTGKFVIEQIRTNLANVVEGEVKQLEETAASRKLELAYEKPQSFPDLMLDETKIRQVVMNFIDNAIYYTPSGGKITVELKDKKDSIEYTVTDTGMGVPKADQQHLFTKFYRAGNARKARPDGTGLGLFMAKKVIVEQGGAIIFKSKEGEGSTFGFTFPKDKLMPKNIENSKDSASDDKST